MKSNNDDPKPHGKAPFEIFKELATKLVQVPKHEADAKEAEYQRERAKNKPKGRPDDHG